MVYKSSVHLSCQTKTNDMILSKTAQENLLIDYFKQGNDTKKSEGFVDGMNAIIEYINKRTSK